MASEEAIVLAGGFGTRLRAVVSDVPKPLAPVAGRPFLAWLLDRLEAGGIRSVILATGYMSEKVERFAGRSWGRISIRYSVEDKPLGTGGAVRQAAGLLAGEAVHVINGDTFLDYEPAALESAAAAAGVSIGIALAEVADAARYGAVELENGLVRGFREKGRHGPGWINAGCYFFADIGSGVLERGEAYSLEADVLTEQAALGRVAGFTGTSGFIDIGVPEDFARAQRLFGR